MAEIRPFRALRYDTGKVRLEDVVTQPYDKITPEMQSAYYERSPANFVRFELRAGDGDPYEGARNFIGTLRREGLLRLDDRPAFYVYEQDFVHPTSPDVKCKRRALIGAGRLYDYDEGVIYRHEQTLTGPKKDREQLLKTTGVQSGLLFMMYEDASRAIEQLAPAQDAQEFVDDLGVKQRIWAITDANTVSSIQETLRELPLFIADGHHRYETALQLRRSREGKYPEDFAMMALVNMKSEGLIVLPTHRTIREIPQEKFNRAIDQLRSEFRMRKLEARGPSELNEAFGKISGDRFACVVATEGAAYLIDAERAAMQVHLGNRTCELDVEALHVIFDELFGITAADLAAQKHVRYHRYAEEALKELNAGAQAAFLIRAVPVEMIRKRSLRGALMPQKSTDFYPKMNSGLTLYSWEESLALPRGASI